MSVTQHPVSAVVHDFDIERELEITGGRITIDETWSPHVQFTAEIAAPDLATLAMLDPRNRNRLRVVMQRLEQGFPVRTRTLELGITTRNINHETETVRIEASTDEAILQRTTNATNLPDDIAFEHQESLRAVINNAALAQAGLPFLNAFPSVDVGVPVLVDSTNQFENPSAEVDLTGAAGVDVALVRQVGAPPHGSAMFRLNDPTSQDSYMTVGGNGGELRNEMSPGTTYTVSATFVAGGPLAGTPGANARRIVAFTRRGSAGYVRTSSPQAPNAAGETRLSVTFTVPEGATEAFVRFYYGHSASSGSVFWDALKLVETVPGDLTTMDYWDGSTTNTDEYAYSWDEIPGLSVSHRTAIVERPPEALMVMPGDNLWDFANSLAQAAGLRLFCDTSSTWRLVPKDYVAVGNTVLGYDELVDIVEPLDLASDTSEWADAAVVRYTWRDYRGDDRERFDAYSSVPTPIRTQQIEIERPYPGPGLAEYVVERSLGRGEDVQLRAITDPLVTASQPVSLTMADGSLRAGIVRVVEFDLDTDEMSIDTRELTAAPPASWVALPSGDSWLDSPIGGSWIGEVV